MNRKPVFFSELAYAAGLLTLALGTALMERADFGMSMVVAPAYLVHLKLAPTLPFFTFGRAEYCLQALLLVLMCLLLRRFRISYLFSFVTAVLYGITLDLMISLAVGLPMPGLAGRIIFYVLGMVICSLGVALLFHTYISPEVYELFVKEAASAFHKEISLTKTVYDCISCLIAVILSFLFFGFGHFEGVKWGTILCALINGTIIGRISRMLENSFDFRDGLPLKKLFGQ